jgi:hypothetical protein
LGTGGPVPYNYLNVSNALSYQLCLVNVLFGVIARERVIKNLTKRAREMGYAVVCTNTGELVS